MKQELEARELVENIAEEVRSAAADARASYSPIYTLKHVKNPLCTQ